MTLNYKGTRLIYQIVFFLLFCSLISVSTQEVFKNYPVRLFLNMSGLSGLGTIISERYLASGMILGVVIAAITLFLGRFFCGWICPMGSVQHFGSFLFQDSEKKTRYVKNSYRDSHKVKYIILLTFLVCAFFGIMLTGYFDPLALMTRFSVSAVVPLFNMFRHQAHFQTVAFQAVGITVLIFIGAFFLNMRQPRFWCRTVCPLGALLSLFSVSPLMRIKRDVKKCTQCGICHEYCQGACEVDKDIILSECVMCMNCIDLCPEEAIEFKFCGTGRNRDATGAMRRGTMQESTGGSSLGGESVSEKALRRGVALTRREFVASGLLAFASVSSLRNFRNISGRAYHGRIRPPGALPEEKFLARCMRCGECMKICPTNVIQGAFSETDIEGLWTPVLKMQYGYCEYDCVLCSQVCPSGAIKEITLDEKHRGGYGRIGTAFIDRARCLPWSFGRTCLVCQEVCPVSPKAIYHQKRDFMPDGGGTIWLSMPYVNAELCIGCGICEYKCPVEDKPAIYVTSMGEFRSTRRKLIL